MTRIANMATTMTPIYNVCQETMRYNVWEKVFRGRDLLRRMFCGSCPSPFAPTRAPLHPVPGAT